MADEKRLEDEVVKELSEEFEIDTLERKLPRYKKMFHFGVEYEKEHQHAQILQAVGGLIDEDIEEIRTEVASHQLLLKQLKRFSKKMREEIENPLRKSIQELEIRKKSLSTDAVLTEKQIIESVDTFQSLLKYEKELEGKPDIISFMEATADIQNKKPKEIKQIPKEEGEKGAAKD